MLIRLGRNPGNVPLPSNSAFQDNDDVDVAGKPTHRYKLTPTQMETFGSADSCFPRNKLNQGQLTVSILSAPLIANCDWVSS